MSKPLSSTVTMTETQIDEIAAALLDEGICCAEVGRGGFFPIRRHDDDDAEALLGRGDELPLG